MFKIDVFDCLSKVAFPELTEDVIEETGEFPVIRSAQAATFDSDFCPIEEYGFKEEIDGVTIDQDGQIQIDVATPMETTIVEVYVDVGSQTKFHEPFKIVIT